MVFVDSAAPGAANTIAGNPRNEREARFLKMLQSRADHQRLWSLKGHVNRSIFLCLAFLRGFQNLYISRKSPLLQEVSVRPTKQFLVINKILPMVRSIVGMLQEVRPRPISLPTDDSIDAILRAQLETAVLQSYHEELELDDIWDEAIEWFVPVGDAFVGVKWNAAAGEDVLSLRVGPDGKLRGKKLKSGRPDVQLYSPLDLYVPYGATKIEPLRCPWWIRIFLVARAGAERLWGPQVRGLRDVRSYPLFGAESWESRILNMGAGVSARSLNVPFGEAASAYIEDDYLLVRELHTFGLREGEPGDHGAEAGGRILDLGDCWGNDLVKFSFIRQPGQFWSTGVVENMLHPQREYNDARSQRAEWRTQNVPRVRAPRDSHFKRAGTTNSPFEIWEYDSTTGGIPGWMEQPSASADFYKDMELMLADLSDLAGVHPTTLGDAPKNLRSASAIRLMQLADQRFHSPTLKSLKSSWKKVYEGLHDVIRRHTVETRKLRLGSSEEWVSFRGSDLSVKPRIEVQLVVESETAKARLEALITDMIQYQWVSPERPEDKALVAKAFELPSAEMAMRTATADVDLQQRELKRMLGDPARGLPGVEVPVDESHRHAEHIAVIDLLTKSREWERWPQDAKRRVLQHREGHADLAAQQAEAFASAGAPIMQQIQAARSPAAGAAPPPTGIPAADEGAF